MSNIIYSELMPSSSNCTGYMYIGSGMGIYMEVFGMDNNKTMRATLKYGSH